MTNLIEAPELTDHGGFSGAYFKVGGAEIFVVDIEAESDLQGRTVMIGHDGNGDEVEIHFFPNEKEEGEG